MATFRQIRDAISASIAAQTCEERVKDIRSIVPSNWYDATMDNADAPCEALQSYMHDLWCTPQEVKDALGEKPGSEHDFWDKTNQACYHVFPDGSLLFTNNAEDEVWNDYHDFVTDSLADGIRAGNKDGSMCWTTEEYDERQDDSGKIWIIDDMDKSLLLLWGDEEEARELAGCAVQTD